MYRNHAVSMAVGRQTSAEDFASAVVSIARRLILSTPHKTHEDAQFLQDVARGRYPMRALERMAVIAQQSTRQHLRDELAGLVLVRSVASESTPDIIIASALETRAQGDADCAVHALEHSRSRSAWMAAREKVRAHIARLMVLAQAIERTTVQ